MPKFKVQQIFQVVKSFEVEAKNQDEAEQITYQMMCKCCDKGNFDDYDDSEPYVEEL